jgi:hypothetical protein
VEAAFALDLSLEAVEEIALKLRDFATAETGHVDMVALWTTLVEVLLSLHMHQVKLINQAMSFQKAQRAIDGHPINLRIYFPSFAKYLAGIEVLLRGLDHAKDGTALMSHTQAAGHQFRL